MAENESTQIRISLINVPNNISPLKLKGYLRQEVEAVQAHAAENSMVIIRLFVPERIIFGLTLKKLDQMLENFVNKYSKIFRIELHPVMKSLSFEEMQVAGDEAKEDIEAIAEDAAEGADDSTIH